MAEISSRTLPGWQTGTPTEEGVYIGFSTEPRRKDGVSIYIWDGKNFFHHTGWYDHAVTHWMKTDLPAALSPTEADHG